MIIAHSGKFYGGGQSLSILLAYILRAWNNVYFRQRLDTRASSPIEATRNHHQQHDYPKWGGGGGGEYGASPAKGPPMKRNKI